MYCVLQRGVAVCCRVLQCVDVCCSAIDLKRHPNAKYRREVLQSLCCSVVLQCVAVCRSVLQCVVVS